jgi:hypothetical protein
MRTPRPPMSNASPAYFFGSAGFGGVDLGPDGVVPSPSSAFFALSLLGCCGGLGSAMGEYLS